MAARLKHTLWDRANYRDMVVTDPVSGRKTTRCHCIEHDQWMITPGDEDYLAPEDRWCRVCGYPDADHKTCGRCKRSFVNAPA